jgi:hypothetical protein
LSATYCLHVYGETCAQDGPRFDFDGLHLTVAAPAKFAVSRHDWEHHNGGREATKGLRLTVAGKETEFVTVLTPKRRKRVPLTTLTLKRALFVQERRRGRKPTVRDCDVTLIMPWEDGKPRTASSHILTPGFNKQGRCGGTVTAKTAGRESMQIEITLLLPRKRKEPERASFVATVEGADRAYTGAYEGTFRGQPRQGAVEGAWQEAGLSPAPLYAAFTPPDVAPVPGGVRVGDDTIVFAGGIDDDEATCYVQVTREGRAALAVTGRDIDMDRSQGDIGLFVPDAGYPFGVIPDWLIRQRIKKPDWYRDVWPLTKYKP